MSDNTSDSAICCAIQQICQRIDSARSRNVSRSIETNVFIKNASPIDFTTDCVVSFAEDYMLEKLLSKYKGFKKSVPSPKDNAINGWYTVENQCQSVNDRLRKFMRGTGYPGSDLITVISTAQHHISRILGTFNLQKVLASCGWGPGATSDFKRGTFRDRKMTRRMSTTREAQPFMKLLIESDPNWIEAITGYYPSGPVSLTKEFWKLTEYSRFSTVPKKWDIDRIIDIQPTANGYLQKGVGHYMRQRLLRIGIDLNSQEHNQEAARKGLIEEMATVDLQNASDSIALELCTLFLPWDWMQYLTMLRTTHTSGGGLKEPKKLQKISAMGNGFTFELETIVFYAITRAVCELENLPWEDVLVYGDDIVCPNKAYDKLVYVFDYFGFQINHEKSFHDGYFRESCGRHFFRNVEVTPIYQKNLVNSPEEVIRFHNRLVRWSERTYGDPWKFEEALSTLVVYFQFLTGIERRGADKIPRIPLGFVSDDGFLVSPDEFDTDCNGGCFTTVYRRSKHKSSERRYDEAYLSLKFSSRALRQVEDDSKWKHKSIFYLLGASSFNQHPGGYVEEDTGKGRYRFRTTYIFSVTTI